MLISCFSENPNTNAESDDLLTAHNVEAKVDPTHLRNSRTYYVSICSDIYFVVQNQAVLLLASLSILNTSFANSMYVSAIDYYEKVGKLVGQYLENTIVILPLATINYVIGREEKIRLMPRC